MNEHSFFCIWTIYTRILIRLWYNLVKTVFHCQRWRRRDLNLWKNQTKKIGEDKNTELLYLYLSTYTSAFVWVWVCAANISCTRTISSVFNLDIYITWGYYRQYYKIFLFLFMCILCNAYIFFYLVEEPCVLFLYCISFCWDLYVYFHSLFELEDVFLILIGYNQIHPPYIVHCVYLMVVVFLFDHCDQKMFVVHSPKTHTGA